MIDEGDEYVPQISQLDYGSIGGPGQGPGGGGGGPQRGGMGQPQNTLNPMGMPGGQMSGGSMGYGGGMYGPDPSMMNQSMMRAPTGQPGMPPLHHMQQMQPMNSMGMGMGMHQMAPPPQQQMPAPKQTKSRKKKATAAEQAAQAAAAAQQAPPGRGPPPMGGDPMQSMAALSHNPMMRTAAPQMMHEMSQAPGQRMMYPQSGPQGWGPPAGYGPPQQYRSPYAPQAPPQQYGAPMYGQQGGYAPPPHHQGYGGYGYPPQQQQQGYPPQQQAPAPSSQMGAQGGPQMRPPQYPMQQVPSPYYNGSGYYPPQSSAPPGRSDSGMDGGGPPSQDWMSSNQQPPQHYMQPPHQQPGQQMPPHQQQRPMLPPHVAQEMHHLRGQLQQLYQQPRTPMVQEEITNAERRLQYLQSQSMGAPPQQQQPQVQQQAPQAPQQSPAPGGHQQQPTTQGPPPPQTSMPSMPNNMTQLMPSPQQSHPQQPQTPQQGAGSQTQPGGPHGPPSMPMGAQQQMPPQQQPPQKTPQIMQPPVSVTQSGSQVQVNIKPEVPGRTLISVYYDEAKQPEYPGAAESAKDSVPPEPIPSGSQNKVYNPYAAPPPAPHPPPSQAPPPQIYPPAHPHHQVPPQQPHYPYPQPYPSQQQQQIPPQQLYPPQQPAVPPPQPAVSEPVARPSSSASTSSNHSAAPAPALISPTAAAPPTSIPQPSPVTNGLPRQTSDDKTVVNEVPVFKSEVHEQVKVADPVVEEQQVEKPKAETVNEQSEKSQEEVRKEPEPEPVVATEPEEPKPEVKVELVNESKIEERKEDKKINGKEVKRRGRKPKPKVVVEEPEEDEEETKSSPPPETPKQVDEEKVEEDVPTTSEETTQNGLSREEDETMDTRDSSSIAPTEESTRDTPEPASGKKKRAPLKRPAVARGRKKKDEPPEDEDEEFTVVKKKKKGGRKSASKEQLDETLEIPQELLTEKRRSGRTKKAEQSYVEEAPDDDDEIDEEEAASIAAAIAAANDTGLIVEKILNMRETEGVEEFLVKYKGRAYMHCAWKNLEELEEGDKRVLAKVKRFKQKRNGVMDFDDEEDFNTDFTQVERILDVSKDNENSEIALIKWRSLPYDEATWEAIDVVPHDKIEQWKQRQAIDKFKVKEKSRPQASEWKKMPEDIVWKDGNELREYQFEGVNWLLFCYYNKQNCILADEMGLGKTVQTITFLHQVWEYGIHGPFLIVVPLSTIHNWQREFETWTDLNAVVYHGSAVSRQIIQENEFYYAQPEDEESENAKLWRKGLVKLDVLITTFEMVVTDMEVLRKLNYRVCIIDEAHRLKNRHCKLLSNGLLNFKMEHRVLLTGTPLQNNIEELFSLLNFLSPQQFASSAEFLEQFGTCKTEEQVQKLQEILKPMMLRRLKEDVEKSLQPKEETIIEVQLSDTQKKYYRAILERNFSHLCKGTSAPSLMNAMMELRKCCNHPFLIQGAEEQILGEMKLLHPEKTEEELQHFALVQVSGKLVLIEKLLPKLHRDGHKVLIFSQMVRVLDLIEEFLSNMSYTYERIDGNVKGEHRQAAIDRFSKPDSDRFVFLLCTRAGGLGINLTAADTVIIFDSDWNPQNDLQAQARCHRIGQTKMVKVYRLITANTYEREMFDKASLKLGLDKAVLQSSGYKESHQALTRKEVEELLKKGAYGSIMDDNSESAKFNEEDIETILQRRTTTIQLEAGVKGGTFSKASFGSSTNTGDIDIDDPNFWSKWAVKANVDIEKAMAGDDKKLIMSEPRQRKKRFEDNVFKEGEEDSTDESEEGGKRKGDRNRLGASARKRRRNDDEDYVTYRPDELAFNKSEYFKVEKVLGSFGWGRWAEMREACDTELKDEDMEHISRTLLLHCIREFRGDEKTRDFVWKLISPVGAKLPKKGDSRHRLSSPFHEGWASLPEYNPPAFALDNSFQRHVHRHAAKLLTKIEQLHFLQKEIIGEDAKAVMEGEKGPSDLITLQAIPETPDYPCVGWDVDCDRSLLIGVFKHGLDNADAMKADEKLIFAKKLEGMPTPADLNNRFRRIVGLLQRAAADPPYERLKWTKAEETEYQKILRSWGVKDRPGDITFFWDDFRKHSEHLKDKPDEEMQEMLYCTLAMCSKAQGTEITPIDQKRAACVEAISARRAMKLMNRLQLMRRVHTHGLNIEELTTTLKLCSSEGMPDGWGLAQDKELIAVVDQGGLEGAAQRCAEKSAFAKITGMDDKMLGRRIIEICTTIETGKWNGISSYDAIDDSVNDDEERRARATVNLLSQAVASSQLANALSSASARGRGGRRRTSADTDKEKMRALMHQSFLHRFDESALTNPLANPMAAAMMQSMFLPQLLGSTGLSSLATLSGLSGLGGSPSTSSSSSSTAAATQALAALSGLAASMNNPQILAALFGMPTSSASTSSATAAAQAAAAAAAVQQAAEDALNLSTKVNSKKPSTNSTTSAAMAAAAAASSQMDPLSLLSSSCNLQELLTLANLPSDTRVPVQNIETKQRLTGEAAPRLKNVGAWLSAHPNYVLDLASLSSATKAVSGPSSSAADKSNKLEPGEIPKSASAPSINPAAAKIGVATNATSAATQAANQAAVAAAAAAFGGLTPDQVVAVFHKQTGQLLPTSKWPTLLGLASWLDKHPEYNVHASCVSVAATVLTKQYADRLGGEPTVTSSTSSASTPSTSTTAAAPTSTASSSTPKISASSTSNSTTAAIAAAAAAAANTSGLNAALAGMDSLQLQLLMQQSLLNQSLLTGFNPYLGLGGTLPTSSSSAKEDAQTAAALSMMSLLNPLGMGAASLDPATIAAAMAAVTGNPASAGGSLTAGTSAASASAASAGSSTPTATATATPSTKQKSRLNAVLEKLAGGGGQ